MKNISIFPLLSIIFILFSLSACSDDNASARNHESAVEHASKHADVRYICPMHPKIVKNQAGNCPICGMNLVKKETPNINKESAVAHSKKHLDSNYVCPMHPQIAKSKAGSCPICGMHLIKKKIEHKSKSEKYPSVKLTADIVQKLGVRTSRVKKSQLTKKIKTVGYVSYNERRLKEVSVGTGGWVENLSARRNGLIVTKGQLLLELYSPEFLKVQKEFIAAQKKDKSGTLRKYGERQESVGPRDRLRYMGVPESMMNKIARKGKPKHRLPIYAPMQGQIVEHYIHKHMYVEEDITMLTIADMSTVWVEANVYEHQLDGLKRGLMADIEVKALPGKKFQGQISYIYPELDPQTRTLKVRLLVPNPESLLLPNMFAEVRILTEPKKNVLTLPAEAVIVTGERESVILSLGKGKYKPVDVTTGLVSEGRVEILSGLNKGARVVTSGQFLIDSEANLQASFNRLNSQ